MFKQMQSLTGKFEAEKQAHAALEKKLKAEEQEFQKKEQAGEQRMKDTLSNLEKEKNHELEINQLTSSQIQKDSSTIKDL